MENENGIKFIDKMYKDLYLSDKVRHASNITDNKYERIEKYLNRLENVHRDIINNDKISLIKRYYYNNYIIKKENITDKYFEHLNKIALDRGFGHDAYTENDKKIEIEKIINEQRESLNRWLDYFFSSDTEMYPVWFKYYVFQSIVKMGTYDKANNRYNRRKDDTISNFPDINREAFLILIMNDMI